MFSKIVPLAPFVPENYGKIVADLAEWYLDFLDTIRKKAPKPSRNVDIPLKWFADMYTGVDARLNLSERSGGC